jgi:hypothetical protein
MKTPARESAIPARSTPQQTARHASAQQPGPAGSAPQPRSGEPATPRRRRWRTPVKPGGNEADGWAIISYLIAGMLCYGGLGWLISRWTGMPAILLPIGMVTGLAISLVMVVLRYGRS